MINIKIARIKMGMSQQEVADKLGVGMQSVSRWERGQTVIPVDKLIRLAEILDTTTDFLLGRE